MKSYTTIIRVLIVALVLIALILVFAVKSLGQDSVTFKITKVGTVDNKKVYWLKSIKKDTSYILDRNNLITVISRRRYVTICDCKTERKKGDKVKVAKSDLIILKDSFTKKDL